MTTQIHRLPLGFVNCFLIRGDMNILIDAGVQKDGAKLFQLLRESAVDPKDISLVFLTHAHQDHTGALSAIKAFSNCKIAVNCHEAPWVEQGCSPPLVATNPLGKFFGWFTRRFNRTTSNIQGTAVDWVLEDKEYSLESYGIRGKILYTPGHTSGSMSLLLESGEAFIGDLVQNMSLFKNHPSLPFLVEDAQVIKTSIHYLVAEGARLIHPAHGTPFKVEAFERILNRKV